MAGMWRRCDVCGQDFVTHTDYKYKLTIGGKVKQACSYTCYRCLQDLKEKSKRNKSEESKE